MNWIKKNFSTVILVIIFFMGLSLLLYPSVSNYWNSLHQSRAIASYVNIVEKLDKNEYEAVWKNAEKYNDELYRKQNQLIVNEEEKNEYEKMLNVGNDGIMCYVEIPKIKVSLPIYHGVDDAILQVAAGHIFGTSLPVGGKNTHCVLSGHRGLPSAKLFTNLDQLVVGDIFTLHTLNETLNYEVDKISVVKPEEVSTLGIIENQDLCTLVTCTPYGVNSHRLLVRGHRVSNGLDTSSKIETEAVNMNYIFIAIIIAILIVIMIVYIIVHLKRINKRRKTHV